MNKIVTAPCQYRFVRLYCILSKLSIRLRQVASTSSWFSSFPIFSRSHAFWSFFVHTHIQKKNVIIIISIIIQRKSFYQTFFFSLVTSAGKNSHHVLKYFPIQLLKDHFMSRDPCALNKTALERTTKNTSKTRNYTFQSLHLSSILVLTIALQASLVFFFNLIKYSA